MFFSDTSFAKGCAAAWVDVVNEFGSGKLSVAEILGPAIMLAEEG
jgi:gamma-glutamyltranspeptidase / glutathione hydrolase